uniref:hypothetical protein n=1 Tax=Nocardioides sp. TaxID=35761 RepID=UPI002B275F79
MTVSPLPAPAGLSRTTASATSLGQPVGSGGEASVFSALVQVLLAGSPTEDPTEEPGSDADAGSIGALAALVVAPPLAV